MLRKVTCLKRYLDRLQDFLDHILSCHTIEHSLDSFKRAAPLQTTLVLWCRDDDAMWIYLASGQSDHRRRDVIETMERCKGTVTSATSKD